MKKKQKIAVITISSIAAVILIAVIIIAVFFPGLSFKLKLRDYPKISGKPLEYSYYDVETPEDFIEISEYGLSLYVPSDVYRKNPDSNVKLYVNKDKDPDVTIIFAAPEGTEGFSLIKTVKGYSVEEFNEFFDFSSFDYPDSTYDYYRMIYSLSMDDFDIRDKSNAEIFLSLAEIKEDIFPDNTLYMFDNGTVSGFAEVLHVPDESSDVYSWMIHFYAPGNSDAEYSAQIVAYDEETIKQIINSAEISTEESNEE